MAFATTVDQQNSAIASIAEGVGRASGEARVGAEAMSRVAGVTTDARSTASGVKDLAGSVAVEGLAKYASSSTTYKRRSFFLSQGRAWQERACKARDNRRFE